MNHLHIEYLSMFHYDFCSVCEEETRHEVREETFWEAKTGHMVLDLKYVCRECGLIKRKGKAKSWL